MATRIRPDSPIHQIKKAFDQETGITQLAQTAKARAAAGQTGEAVPTADIIDTSIQGLEALKGLTTFPNYLMATVPPEKRAELEAAAAQLGAFGEMSEALKGASAEEKALIGAMLAQFDGPMNTQLDAQFDQLIGRQVKEVADQILAGGFDKRATALVNDLGVGGQVTKTEIKALAAFLEADAKKTLGSLTTISENAGHVSTAEVLRAGVSDLNASLATLTRLRTELAP